MRAADEGAEEHEGAQGREDADSAARHGLSRSEFWLHRFLRVALTVLSVIGTAGPRP